MSIKIVLNIIFTSLQPCGPVLVYRTVNVNRVLPCPGPARRRPFRNRDRAQSRAHVARFAYPPARPISTRIPNGVRVGYQDWDGQLVISGMRNVSSRGHNTWYCFDAFLEVVYFVYRVGSGGGGGWRVEATRATCEPLSRKMWARQ